MNLENFIGKYVKEFPQCDILGIAMYLYNSGVKQNVIIYFYKKKLFLHTDVQNIVSLIIDLKDSCVESVLFINSCFVSKYYLITYHILKHCIYYKVQRNITKQTVNSFHRKTNELQQINVNVINYLPFIQVKLDKPWYIVNNIIELDKQNKLNIENVQLLISPQL